MNPFGVIGVDPAQWRAQPWWIDAPAVTLPGRTTHLVVLAAHPDDETLGVGGLLNAAASRLDRITVVVATDGAASHPRSPTHSPADLATIRRSETTAAVNRLAQGAELVQLGLPDGRLAEHESELVQALGGVLGPDQDVWLLSTSRLDGHTDHTAAAMAARRIAADRSRTRLFEYPIWFWHVSRPGEISVSLVRRIRRFELTPANQRARAQALACYPSQLLPLSHRPGDEAVLPEQFLAHFRRGQDILFIVDPPPPGPSS